MIKIEKANKYFNRFKKNKVHVINNTSLELGDSGLVALLGPSGCGKTTLLNVLGGLDKLGSGKIYINGKRFNSCFTSKVDKARNLNIGYIFQDYKLVEKLSVYDNVAIVLKMIGLKDKKEIKKRVEYVLDKVGMLRYKRRPANMLSGGERQRVGIARAIVKDPDIILADEPTGNLDSKNSLEVMKIIKAISKEKLVILVTHEQNLAKFYASRIIEIQDGKLINDYENNEVDLLDYEVDNTFYLKDFQNHDILLNENNNINIYSNDKEKVDIDIVIRNGNIYIQSKDNYKVEVVDETSSIEFINDSYKKISKEDIDKYDFDFKDVINNNFKKRYSSLFNPITLIINGFKKIIDFPIIKKILLLGFVISASFIMYSASRIAKTFDVKDSDFIKYHPNYLLVDSKKLEVEDYLKIELMENVLYVIPTKSLIQGRIFIDDYYQSTENVQTINGSLVSNEYLNKDTLIYGRMPESEYEIVIDKMLYVNYGEKEFLTSMGIKSVKQFLNKKVQFGYLPNYFTIVGITDSSAPTIYAQKSLFTDIINYTDESFEYWSDNEITDNTIVDYNLISDKIILKEGRLPLNDYEIIVNIDNKEEMKIDKEIDIKVNGKKLKVVGYYYSIDSYNCFITNNNTVKYDMINKKSDMAIYTNDKEDVIQTLREENYNVIDSYEYSKEKYLESRRKNVRQTLLISGIIILISFVEIYLMIRSSFLSRIKEVGIFRAIGVKKHDIYKMFFGEIFAITTIASIPGLLLMAYALNQLSKVRYLENYFMINPIIIFISIIIVYLFNLIVGLIPVYIVVRKTPAQILARTDLD